MLQSYKKSLIIAKKTGIMLVIGYFFITLHTKLYIIMYKQKRKRNMKTSSLLLAGMTTVTLAMTSCKESNLFDKNDYQQLLKEHFPVENVDPIHDWTITRTVTANVNLGNHAGEGCKIMVYTSDPKEKNAQLISDAFLTQTAYFKFTLPIACENEKVYVIGDTEKGRVIDGYYSISGGRMSLTASSPVTPSDDAANVTAPQCGYIYCFEDNFPSYSDYDFNDLVLDVKMNKTRKTLAITVELRAVGTTKNIACAMRLNGVLASHITNITKAPAEGKEEFGHNMNNQLVYQMYYKLPDDSETTLFSGISGNAAVLPLFNDAHYAISLGKDVTNTGMRYKYNTVTDDNDMNAKSVSPPANVYTFTFADGIESKINDFSLEDLDIFIIEEYNGGMYEIHTFPYKSAQVLHNFTGDVPNFGNNNPYNDYFTWSLLIPDSYVSNGEVVPFRHTIEGLPIAKKRDNILGGAYYKFVDWAQDRYSNLDWYMYPEKEYVFE